MNVPETQPLSIRSVITNTIIIITTVVINKVGIIIIKLTGMLIKKLIVEWKSNWNECDGIYLQFKAGWIFFPLTFKTFKCDGITGARVPRV